MGRMPALLSGGAVMALALPKDERLGGKGRMVSKFFLLLASTAFGVLLACGVALAAVSATADPGTVDADGRVSAVLRVGDRVYLGGSFHRVNGVPRERLAAVDAATGELTDWNPGADGSVLALAASGDGSRVFAGGEFTQVGGYPRERLAAIDAASGSVEGAWNPRADLPVRTLAVSGNRVYLGGDFASVNGQGRSRLAIVDAVTGELDPNWRPSTNARVRKLSVSDNQTGVYIGGDFTEVSGRSRLHLAALSAATGATQRWRPDPKRPVLDFRLSGKRLYTAEGGTGGGAVAAYGLGTGRRAWALRGDGDCQAVTTLGGKVYVGGHFTSLGGRARLGLAAVDSRRGTLDRSWRPKANAQVWELTPDTANGRLYAGGDFTEVSGTAHKRFVQFSG